MFNLCLSLPWLLSLHLISVSVVQAALMRGWNLCIVCHLEFQTVASRGLLQTWFRLRLRRSHIIYYNKSTVWLKFLFSTSLYISIHLKRIKTAFPSIELILLAHSNCVSLFLVLPWTCWSEYQHLFKGKRKLFVIPNSLVKQLIFAWVICIVKKCEIIILSCLVTPPPNKTR